MDSIFVRMIWPVTVQKVLVAVSGGADSVALLCLLRQMPNPPSLLAAHFEHGIRGEDSRQDAAFVRGLCAQWGVPLVEGSADVPMLARRWGMGLEQAAREARYAFLRSTAAAHHCEGICLAHHLDDQAESVLMHLLRGSGLGGLAGMQPVMGDLIRPLLGIRKRELIDYLQKMGVAWREDATNQLDDNPRNALRLKALPILEDIYPGAASAIGRLSRIAAGEDDYLQAVVRQELSRAVRTLPIGYQVTLGAHPALLRRMIRSLWPLEGDQVERVLALCERGGRLALPEGAQAEVIGNRLYLLRGQKIPRIEQPLCARMDLGELGQIKVTRSPSVPERQNPFVQVLSQAAVEGAVVRTRRPGDYIVPLGMSGRQKLSDYFINRRVDRPLRDMTLLLARGSEILWVIGVGISENVKLRGDEPALRIEHTTSQQEHTKD